MNSYCYKTKIPIFHFWLLSPIKVPILSLAEKVSNKATLERFPPNHKRSQCVFKFVRSYYVGLVSIYHDIPWYTSLNKKHGCTSRHLHARARNLYVQHWLFGLFWANFIKSPGSFKNSTLHKQKTIIWTGPQPAIMEKQHWNKNTCGPPGEVSENPKLRIPRLSSVGSGLPRPWSPQGKLGS